MSINSYIYISPYVYVTEFEVITDHNPLKWVDNAKDPHSRLSCWSLSLQRYPFTGKHRPGKSHGNVDALSRLPDTAVHKEDWKENKVTSVYAIDSPGLQLDRVKTLQHQDPPLGDLINYFKTGEIPTDSTYYP